MDNTEFYISIPCIDEELKIEVSFNDNDFEVEKINDLPVFLKDVIDLTDFRNKIIKESDLTEQVGEHIAKIKGFVGDFFAHIDVITGSKQRH